MKKTKLFEWGTVNRDNGRKDFATPQVNTYTQKFGDYLITLYSLSNFGGGGDYFVIGITRGNNLLVTETKTGFFHSANWVNDWFRNNIPEALEEMECIEIKGKTYELEAVLDRIAELETV